MIKKTLVALATALMFATAMPPAAHADGPNAVWLWNSPNLNDPHSPPWVDTAYLGPCYTVGGSKEILSASNLNRNWKIRFYRSTYCSGAWGYSTIWEYGSGHTYTDNCVCYTGGGAQSFRRGQF